VPVTLVITLEKAYSEPQPISALNMVDIRRLVSYISDERKNIYDLILACPLYNTDTVKINVEVCFRHLYIVCIIGLQLKHTM
jgi:hypothetical protein